MKNFYKNLIDHALKAKTKAYAPYSGYKVGAAVLTDKDTIYTGSNVENASYGLTNCAEQSAINNAVSNGESKFKAIAVVSDSSNFIYPCGACRQVIFEFGKNIKIIVGNNKGKYIVKNISKLLPNAFCFRKRK